jgi:hypothetical protein
MLASAYVQPWPCPVIHLRRGDDAANCATRWAQPDRATSSQSDVWTQSMVDRKESAPA